VSHDWAKFWALPAVIAAVVLAIFFFTFWDKDSNSAEKPEG
jgi:hypothetical protein